MKTVFDKPKEPLLDSILNLEKYKHYLDKFADDPQALSKELAKGDFSQKALDVSEKEYEKLYFEGHQAFAHKDYEQAVAHFSVLAFLDQFRPDIWLCLGHSYYFLNLYTEALQAYAFAHVIDNEDPRALYFIGITLELLGNQKEAQESFEEAIEKSKKDHKYHEWEQKAIARKNASGRQQ